MRTSTDSKKNYKISNVTLITLISFPSIYYVLNSASKYFKTSWPIWLRWWTRNPYSHRHHARTRVIFIFLRRIQGRIPNSSHSRKCDGDWFSCAHTHLSEIFSLWIICSDIPQERRCPMGWHCTKTIRMEHWTCAFELYPLLYPHPLRIHSTISWTPDDCRIRNSRRNPNQYRTRFSHRHADESNNYCLPPLHHLHVVRISGWVLCWLLYLCMVSPKMMDEKISMTKLHRR